MRLWLGNCSCQEEEFGKKDVSSLSEGSWNRIVAVLENEVGPGSLMT